MLAPHPHPRPPDQRGGIQVIPWSAELRTRGEHYSTHIGGSWHHWHFSCSCTHRGPLYTGRWVRPQEGCKVCGHTALVLKELTISGKTVQNGKVEGARKEKNADRHTCLYICRELGGHFFPDFFPLPIPEKRAGKVIVNIQSPRPLAGEPLNFPPTPAPPQQPAQVWPGTSVVLSPDSPAFGEGEGRRGLLATQTSALFGACSPAPRCPPLAPAGGSSKSSLSPMPPGAGYIWMLKVMTHLHAVLPPACLTP